MYSSFVSLSKFIPGYLTPFVAMVNGIDSLISFSHFSLLVYSNCCISNASNFCVSTLYRATLLSSLINSSDFVMEKAVAPHSSTLA